MIRDGTLPLRKPGTWICCPMVLYAASRLGFSSSYGTSTVILTRVGLTVSRALFTTGLRAGRRAGCAGRSLDQWRRLFASAEPARSHAADGAKRPRAHASRSPAYTRTRGRGPDRCGYGGVRGLGAEDSGDPHPADA